MNKSIKLIKNRSKYSIVLLYPFFGKFPGYITYFLRSCKYNADIKFIIFSDHEIACALPKNVDHIKMDLGEFRKLCIKKLKCNISVDPAPFKLCDFRPAFGLLFNDLIKDYDFWGYGDLDVIFGKIRNFFTTTILSDHDLIFVRHDYATSWLSLYKNNDKVNNLFRLSKDYLKVFSSSIYFNFDETNFKFSEFSNLYPFNLIVSEIESLTHLVKRLSEKNQIAPYFEMHAIEGVPGRIKWDRGRLFYKNKFEIIAYHLKQFKNEYNIGKINKPVSNCFYITTKKIIHKNVN